MEKLYFKTWILIASILLIGSRQGFSQCYQSVNNTWGNIPKIYKDAFSANFHSGSTTNFATYTYNEAKAIQLGGVSALSSIFDDNRFSIDFMVKAQDIEKDKPRIIFSTECKPGGLMNFEHPGSIYNQMTPKFYIALVEDNDNSNDDFLKLNITGHTAPLRIKKEEWAHVTVVFDGNTVTLYKERVTSSRFSKSYSKNQVINNDSFNNQNFGTDDDYVYRIGHTHYHFKTHEMNYTNSWVQEHKFYNLGGHVSGFRVWKKALTESEIDYIKYKTFKGADSFHPDFSYLNSKLKVNLLTDHDEDGFYDQKDYVNVAHDEEIGYDGSKVPSYPVKPYNLEVAEESFLSIRVEWEEDYDPDCTTERTYRVYRKERGEDDDEYKKHCTTHSPYYDDTEFEEEDFGDLHYTYMVKPVVKISSDPLHIGSNYYYGEPIYVDADLKYYPAITNLNASDNLCDGTVQLRWDRVSCSAGASSSYTLMCKVEDEPWQIVSDNIVSTNSPVTYEHQVPQEHYGKQIKYKVDANGDNHRAYSNVEIGKANQACTAVVEDLNAQISGGNIRLDWDFTPSGPPVSSFNIYRKKDSDPDFTLFKSDIGTNNNHFEDEEATMCQTYLYKIATANSCGVNPVLSDASNSIYLPQQDFDKVFTTDNYFIEGSKGYFSDKVLLEWNANPESSGDINSYEIYRRKQNQPYTYLTTIENPNANSYEDLTTEANVVYNYFIRAVGECANNTVYSDTVETVGFRVKTGIVSGNVSYAGGNAVANVPIAISKAEGTVQTCGNFEMQSVSAYSDAFKDDSIFYKPFTAEMWLKATNSDNTNQVYFSLLNGVFYLQLYHMTPVVKLNQKSLAFDESQNLNIASINGDTVLTENQWYHITVSVNPDSSLMRLFLNDKLIGSTVISNTYPWADANNCDLDISQANITLGNAIVNNDIYHFQGQIDELRIWQKARSQQEVADDYNLLLAGNEPGLIGYYRLDENFGSFFYDISKTNNLFNKNDFEFKSSLENVNFWSQETPSFEQLHAGSKTDNNGNYTITGIRYSGEGSVFTVTPIYGSHVFNPENTSLYIGDGSPVQNGVDFTDQSSFNFSASVYYSGTNVPVEGAKVYVDNTAQFDEGGHPIKTNEFGQLNVSVPIGSHYVSVKKDKHTFEHNGQWPHPTEAEPYKKFNFMEDVTGILFKDSTRVNVCGRFVGGDVEGDKKVGFNLSNANIGKGQIVLSTEAGYEIDNGNTSMSISTSPISGEYKISLLPIVYKIDSVYNNHYAINILDLGQLDLSLIPESTIVKDTTYTENFTEEGLVTEMEVDSFMYHFKRNFIHYEIPTISLQNSEMEDFIGEKEYLIYDSEGEVSDTIDLVNNSPFNYPVFIMGKFYGINLKVGAVYTKYDEETGSPIEYDTVPVEDANIHIVNNLEVNSQAHNFTTDANGLVSAYQEFQVGLPNMQQNELESTSYTKTMTITGTSGNLSFAWNNGDVYRAYVLGGVDAGGVNFVSYGPELTQFILRDPPGDRSYTSLEQGSEYSVTQHYKLSKQSISDFDNILMMGVRFEIGGGLAGPVFTSDVQSDFNAGLTTTHTITKGGEYIKHYAFNETFSTSDSPEAVGSMADVYIGQSMNMFYTETNNLRIYSREYLDETGNERLSNEEMNDSTALYTIGKRPGFAVTEDASSTKFIYTQNHILNNLLPSYRDLIYILLSTDKYTSKVPATHPYYGLSNTAEVWADTIALTGDSLPSYVFHAEHPWSIDSVALLNQNISIWLQTIALNEASKVAPDLEVANNISFDGNAGAYSNSISVSNTSVTNQNYAYNFEVFGGSTSGFDVLGKGFITYSQTYKNWDRQLGETGSEQKTLKWKYVIDDSNQRDYFSVDVLSSNKGVWEGRSSSLINASNYNDIENVGSLWRTGVAFAIGKGLGKLINPLASQTVGMVNKIAISAAYMGKLKTYSNNIENNDLCFGLQGASPIFSLRGGQSSCPYEGEEYTAFYLDSASLSPILLHPGTQNHEAPAIAVEPATRINVPEGEAAVFQLQLMNESPTEEDITYELSLDESSNPYGAIIKVDGLSPNRPFFIPAGQTLTKTLTVEKGASEVMEYDDIRLILHSACQFNPDNNVENIADTVAFSAHFVPTCTEAYFDNITDNWVVNVSKQNLLPIQISGYNTNQSTFEKIYVMYQQSGSTPTNIMTLYNDTINTDWNAYSGKKMYIGNIPQVNFDWDTSPLNDGNYSLYLTSTCSDGSIYESEHFSGVIDRITPKPYGTPQPSDGVLSYGENISVLFNEDINTGYLNNFGQSGAYSYISVRGVLNGTDLIDSPYLLHDANVHFDGQGNFLKMDNINLDHTNFTIEFWAKRDGLGESNIISIGNPAQGGLWIGFDANDHFVVRADGQSLVSNEAYTTINDWGFYSVAYEKGENENNAQFILNILSGTNTDENSTPMTVYSSLEGSMYVGYCPYDQKGFYGNLHELRIWNYKRDAVEIASQKARLLNGTEEGLYGLWPLNEASGEYAGDIAFGRNATVNATWNVSRNGQALLLDGTNSFTVNSQAMAFSEQADFTLEFWYKTQTPLANANLFSNGNMDIDSNPNAWNIIATSGNQIVVSNNGTEVSFDAEAYLDNNWHHFAMSLNRIGYLNIYIDGQLVKTAPSSNLKGFAASQFVAGSRWYKSVGQDNFDQYTTGVMDEIRIWNTARSSSQIMRYKNYSLKGDEPGLKAYFPFENVTIENPSLSNQSADNFALDTVGVAENGTLDAEYYTSESPNIKLQRPEVTIPHNIVVSDNGVVITPNIEHSKIENQILDISIKKVKDLHNNVMASTLSWTAFIDKNNVVWEMQNLDIEQTVGEETTVSVNIRNKSGLNEAFEVTNIPSWLEVNPSSGSLEPLEVKEIQMTVKPELNIGTYQRSLNLVSSLGYNEGLDLSVRVNGFAPDWTVNPEDYLYTANVIGQLSIANTLSTDTGDIVACFVGDECRGLTKVKYFADADLYLCFMSIYANENGENMSFKVYDASTGSIYANVTPILTFNTGGLYGSVSNPLPINATNYIDQAFTLNAGWNWLSFNVYADEFNDLNTCLDNLTTHPGDFLKSQSAFSVVSPTNDWQGSLNNLDVISSYKLNVNQAQSFSVSGYRVVADTVQIPIVEGWNWIGYPLSIQKPLMEALSSLNPSENDLIKSQHQFAVYSDILGWVGSLTYMQPGKGYILHSSSDGVLEYSSSILSKSPGAKNSKETAYLPATRDNMTIIAELNLDNPELYDVIAYDANGMCAKAKPIIFKDGSVRFFITLNSVEEETIRFKAQTKEEGLFAKEIVVFKGNEMKGSLDSPMMLNFDKKETSVFTQVYPNPFREEVYLNLYLNDAQQIQLSLYSSLGREIASTNIALSKGSHRLNLIQEFGLKQRLNEGVYMLKVKYNDEEEFIKIVKH